MSYAGSMGLPVGTGALLFGIHYQFITIQIFFFVIQNYRHTVGVVAQTLLCHILAKIFTEYGLFQIQSFATFLLA